MTLITIVLLFIFLFLSVPIAVAIGLSSIIAIIFASDVPLFIVIQRIFNSADSFPLMAIPFFILAGNLMEKGGLSHRLVAFSESLVGHRTGGLAMVAIMTSMLFGAISGSSAATVAAIGSIMIPAMVKKGYDRKFAAATTAAGGELGIIIPPSVPMIVFGIAAGVSIGDMFIAGIVPGIMIGTSLMLTANIISRIKGYKGSEKSTWGERFTAFRKAILALIMPIIILGGIYSGMFTPTEAAVIAVVYTIIVGMFIYRELKPSHMVTILKDSFVTTAIVMIIISVAGIFNWIIAQDKVPMLIANFFTSITENPIVFLIIVNLILFVVGMFMETGAAIIILAPILTPIAVLMGIDPVHFGIIVIVNLAMGMLTPPLGVNLFISCQIADIRLDQIIKPIAPYLLVIVINLLIITYVPSVSLFLVELMK